MRKKHDYGALLKYMRLLEEGYSIRSISDKFGIGYKRLQYLWILYQTYGSSVLHRKHYAQISIELKQQIIRDIEKNNLTLVQASLKYGVSADRVKVWRRIVREQGFDALLITKKRGRPRKKKPEEMTELELLRVRVRQLEIENALLKK